AIHWCEGSNKPAVHPDEVPKDIPVGGHKPPRTVHLAANKKRTKGLCGAKGLSPVEQPRPGDLDCTRCLSVALSLLGDIINHNADACGDVQGTVNHNAGAADET